MPTDAHSIMLNMVHDVSRIPSQPVSPPEPDEATLERNLTLSIVGDCQDALTTLRCRLEELDFALMPDTTVEDIEAYLAEKMED